MTQQSASAEGQRPSATEGEVDSQRLTTKRADASGSTALILILLAILAGALLLRCWYISDIFLDGRILPFDPDSSYHLWRIEQTVRSGVPPRYDFFLNAPEGARVLYPDGFDGLLGRVIRLLLGADATRFQIQVAALLAMPGLGLLSVLAVFFIGRRAGGNAVALVAASLAAVLPVHVSSSFLGRVDHHVVEMTLPALALAIAVGGAEPAGQRRHWRCGVLSGMVMAAVVHAVPTAMLQLALVAAALLLSPLGRRGESTTPTTKAMLWTLAVASGSAALLTLPDGLSRGGFAYDEPSLLPSLLLLAGAIAASVLALAARWVHKWLALIALLGLGLAALALLLLLHGPAEYLRGVGMLGLVNEAQPIWRDWEQALSLHSAALPGLPLLLAFWCCKERRLVVWGLAALGLLASVVASLQVRFGFLLAVPATVAFSATLVHAWKRARIAGRAVLLGVVLGALFLPARYLAQTRLTTSESLAVLEASEWLAAHTPAPGGERASRRAAYSVLTMWGHGTHVAYLAERPVVAGAFYHGGFARGVADALAAWFGDEDPAAMLARRAIRYLVVPAVEPEIVALHRRILHLGPARAPVLLDRLLDTDGSSLLQQAQPVARVVPALDELRLVHESVLSASRRGRPIAASKIFERVPGVSVEGGCQGASVRARVRVSTNRGRQFDFVNAAPCQGGTFRLRVPYPGVIEIARQSQARLTTVTAGEADVRRGRLLLVR